MGVFIDMAVSGVKSAHIGRPARSAGGFSRARQMLARAYHGVAAQIAAEGERWAL